MTIPSKAPLSDADYCAIEDALQSTEKGRRFMRAYIERNRSLESLRLLRSISRLHRAALGTPGSNGELCRDLASVLKSVSKHRRTALECSDNEARCGILVTGMEDVEACLIALIESLEEKIFESLDSTPAPRTFASSKTRSATGKTEILSELSSLFPGE